MRKWKIWALVLLVLWLGARWTIAEAETSLTAIDVAKGDALLLTVGEERFLIDSGKKETWGKLNSALKDLGVSHLNGVILTHTDKDHAGNMEMLAGSDIAIDAWYASAIYADPKKESKHPLVKAAALRGHSVQFLYAGDEIPCEGGTIRVLAPLSVDPDNENNNSMVLRVDTADGSMLLTGDMEIEEEIQLLNSGANLKADILKVAHHGDDDATSLSLARAVEPQVAVISTNSYDEPDTPDPRVLAILESVGAETYVTEDAGVAIIMTLSGGEVHTDMMVIQDRPERLDVVLVSVKANPDDIVLENRSGAAVDLTDWYLYVDRDEECFFFPAGTVLEAGQQLRVSTRESLQQGDVIWDEKNVISNKKEDVVAVYDPYGRIVDAYETNG